MPAPLKKIYGQSLWELYARAVSLVTIIVIVVAFVMGGRDLLKLAFPKFTLNASLHEKYKSNESYTNFGAFKKGLTHEQITRERIANYEKLLSMERRGAKQNLANVGLALVIVAILNGVLLITYRFKKKRERCEE